MIKTILFVFLTAGLLAREVRAQAAAPITLPVDSPAFLFSPANWTGDDGRGGGRFRQTWNSGAYFSVAWSTPSDQPAADVLFDVSMYDADVPNPPSVTYQIDGVWVDGETFKDGRLPISKLKGAGRHNLTLYFKCSDQAQRWGAEGVSGKNILRVTGLQVDAGSSPVPLAPNARWAWIVGDSITEGIASEIGNTANQLSSWSFFVGQGLQADGYDYCISACGWSGWLHRGDASGDVPAFYPVSNSVNGKGGSHDDAVSRWNKIDGNKHSLLDARQHVSSYGNMNQEPSLILINYGTNEGLNNMNASDVQSSVQQCLEALRGAAPNAKIVLIVPFGQYEAPALLGGLAAYTSEHPDDRLIQSIDLGPSVANALADGLYWSGIHPNLRGQPSLPARSWLKS